MATPLQAPYAQFFDANGDPLSGGKVYTYAAGTLTPKATYTDASGNTEADNPIILDSAGRAAIWIVGTYRIDVYTSTDALVRSTDEVPAFTAGGDMTKAVYDPANIIQQVLGTTAAQAFTNKTGTFSAGTTSVAPVKLASGGVLLTTADAGALEYDGNMLYFTPQSTERGIVPTAQTLLLENSYAGTNGTSTQKVFNKVVSLSANRAYRFRGLYAMSKTAGATSHTIGLSFASGTVGIQQFTYKASVTASTTSFTAGMAAPVTIFGETNGNIVATGAIASANSFVTVEIVGTIVTTTAGTLSPDYALSAAPGGAYTTAVGSWFEVTPYGINGTNTSVGTWA